MFSSRLLDNQWRDSVKVARESHKLKVTFESYPATILGVAQSGSASALGAEGRRFESYYRDQNIDPQ